MSAPTSNVLSRAAAEAQRLLGDALHSIRAAGNDADASAREELAQSAASVEGVLATLREIAEGRLDDDRARAALAEACALLQALHQDAAAGGSLARATSVIYASAGPRSVRPAQAMRRTSSAPAIEAVAMDPDELDEDIAASLRSVPPSGVRLPSLPPPSGNRRSEERFALDVDVGVVSDSQFYAGLSLDLSSGGLFVATYQPRPIGAKVTLNFVLPFGPSITAEGRVRWHRDAAGGAPPGMGVEFTNLQHDDLAAIEHFCEHRAPLYHDVDA